MNQLLEEDILAPVQLRGILTAEEIKSYRRPVAWRQIVDFSLVWVQILLGVALFVWSPGILTYVVAVLLIGGAQHGLGLVSHEFIHRNVIPGNIKLNDFIGSWFFSAPGGVPFTLFRYRHFQHHRHFSTDQDTKVIYRRDLRGVRFLYELLKKLLMVEYFAHVVHVLRQMKRGPAATSAAGTAGGPGLVEILPPLIVTQVVIFAAFWMIHPLAYFILWLLPLLTVQTLFNNIRAIVEHQPLRSMGGRANSPYFLGTAGPFVRTAGTNAFERLFFCKINFGYHVEHHLWPQVNYQFLPAVHRRLIEHHIFSDARFGLETSYLSSIGRLVRQGKDSPAWYARPVAHDIPKQDVRLCPLCDSSRKRPLYTMREHEYDNTTDDWFHMVECLDCSAWYLDPRPADSMLQTIYPPNYYTNVLEAGPVADVDEVKEKPAHRLGLWMFKRRIRPIERHLQLTPNTRWLDIGCGLGLALESMYQLHGMRGVGVDMSESAVDICRQRGFEAHAVKFEDFRATGGAKFHFIHSSHLIEHVASPLSYLQKVFDLLEPGGITVFITPNTQTWEAHLFGSHWGGLHVPRHWVLFNSASAVRAAKRIGFEHVETCFSTNSQFWVWTFHSLLLGFLPRRICDVLFPSDHRFLKSGVWMVLRGGFFTAVDMLNTLCTGRSSNMAVILRKPDA